MEQRSSFQLDVSRATRRAKAGSPAKQYTPSGSDADAKAPKAAQAAAPQQAAAPGAPEPAAAKKVEAAGAPQQAAAPGVPAPAAAKKVEAAGAPQQAAAPGAPAPAAGKQVEAAAAPAAPQQKEKPAAEETGRPIIQMQGIVKRFYIGQPNELEILHGIDLTVYEGEFVAVVGESGSGKSTLMNIIGALDVPTEGAYYLDGVNVSALKDQELSRIRCQKIGFVFQTFNLIPRTTALGNVALPMLYNRVPGTQRNARARQLLELVGMGQRMDHKPNELSGGQKQRVAIARAMANDPSIILADEPTGALDSKTGRLVMDIFHQLHREQGKTIVLITHSEALAAECQRVITISDGRITGQRKGGMDHAAV